MQKSKQQSKHRETNVDTLISTAVFAKDEKVRKKARASIRKHAVSLGIVSSSLHSFYNSIGKGEVKDTFTVPAFNIRALTYDTARLIFRLSKKYNIFPFIFEIARSEIEYTDQRPDEYALCVLAAAIKENYKGPVFIQGDHFQFSKKRFLEDAKTETEKIKSLIKESIEAQFYNIDIDASTLVDLEKDNLTKQQKDNYSVTAELSLYIRSLEPKGITVSIGGEIGHIGGKNSTKDDLIAFMNGYHSLIKKTVKGISKISVQTGTSHGGTVLSNGKIADVQLDFGVIRDTGKTAREKYHLGGVVQHGASTLPENLFSEFPKNKTLEIHLATGFQNIVYDTMPKKLKSKIYRWIENNLQKEWEKDWTKDQFLYKTRKKAIGPFKKELWSLSKKEKAPILHALEKQFLLLFKSLEVVDKKHLQDRYYG